MTEVIRDVLLWAEMALIAVWTAAWLMTLPKELRK